MGEIKNILKESVQEVYGTDPLAYIKLFFSLLFVIVVVTLIILGIIFVKDHEKVWQLIFKAPFP